jgi:hypothetical protein
MSRDNPKSFVSYQLGNPSMSSWIDNFLRRDGQYLFPFPKPNPPIPTISPNNKIIVIITPNFPVGYELIQYVIQLGLVTSNVECYFEKENETSLSLVQKYYNNGYRFFIGTQNSQELSSLTSFFEEHIDCCYFNTYSTIFNLFMPSNMIRSAVNDLGLTQYINSYFLLNISNLLKLSENSTMYTPLSKTEQGEPAFQKFIYIYEQSNYTSEFLNMLETTLVPSLNVTIETYLINDASLLPSDLITLLTQNPVSNLENYQTSQKTLFILNSSNPQNLLDKFTDQTWYDNYFFMCDPFFDDLLVTKYPITYSFLGAGCFSSIGYKLSKKIDPNQDISPVALSVVNLIIQLGQWYLNNYKPTTTMTQLLTNLSSIQYINIGNDNNNYWYEKQIYIYHSSYNNQIQNEYRIFKQPITSSVSASPTENAGITQYNNWSSITYGNGLFVSVSSDGYVGTSPDGITWTIRTCPVRRWSSITFGNNIFVAVAKSSMDINGIYTNQLVMTSPNGINWTIRNAVNKNDWVSITYGSYYGPNNNLIHRFIAVSSVPISSSVMFSNDGFIWSGIPQQPSYGCNSITYGIKGNIINITNSLFAIASTRISNGIKTSSSGVAWYDRNAVPCKGIFWGSPNGVGLFIAIQNILGKILISTDGINWQFITLTNNYLWNSIAFGNNLFVAVSSEGKVMTSSDGSTWTLRTAPVIAQWTSIIFGNNLFVVVSNNGITMRSSDGIIWSSN